MRSTVVWTTIVLLLLSMAALGQTFRGAINGTVLDPSGAVVPNAQVKATEIATGVERSTVTTSDGQYAFQDIPIGRYRVNVAAAHFKSATVDNIPVTAGKIYTLPVKLELGQESTTLEVSAAALTLDTTTQTQSLTIPTDVVESTPLNGRDYTQLISVEPGYGGYSVGGFGSLNGTRPNQMNWQIDGVDNNDMWHNIPAVNQGGVSGIAGIILPLDSIEEFSAQTESGAEGGRNAGGTVNLVTKSGTNTLHGSVYFFDRNEFYSASSPFFQPTAQNPKSPPLRNINYGLSVGGPLIKNKTFWFVAYEKQQYKIGLSGLATEPSDAWINKSLAVLNQFGVPESPLSATLMGPKGFWPRNVVGGLPGTVNNFFSPVASTGYSYNGVIKVDHNLTDKHRLSFRWFGGQGSQTAPLGSSPALGTASSNLHDYFEVAPLHVYNFSLVLNSQMTSRFTNQVLFGVNYFNQVFHDFNNSFDTKALGLFLSPDALVNGKPILGAPNVVISGFEQIGLTPPEGRNDITGHLTEIASYTVGSHQLRFGGEVRQANVNEFYYRRGTGKFTFDGTQGPWRLNNVNPDGSTSPNPLCNAACQALDTPTRALADYLAGNVASSTIAVGKAERFVKVNAFNLYFQDAWQITRRLNLNFGMRYEYFGPMQSDFKDIAVFIPGKGLQIQGKDIPSIFPPDRNNFAPRFGFAWQPTEKGDLVVRGGIGVFYDQININPFLDFRPPIAAPSGIQGNPFGPSPVSTFSLDGYNWDSQPGHAQFGGASIFPGVQVCTDPFCTNAPGQNVYSVNQNFRTPYFYSPNLQIEKGFGQMAVFQIGYVGNFGHKLNLVSNINQNGAFPTFGNIIELNSNGTSNYHALQTTFKVRSWHGLTSQFGYTWSHSLDQISQYRGVILDDATNRMLDYGNGDFDTRHLFTANVNYDIPGLSHGPRFLTHDWHVSTMMNWHSGQPYDETLSSVTINGFTQGLSLLGDPFSGLNHKFSAAQGGTLWINPTAFCAAGVGTCPTGPVVAGTALGNVRRNTFHAPGYGSVDLSVFKNIPIKERLKVQLRAEMFNLLNRINLASGPSAVATGGCGPDPITGRCAAVGTKAYSGFGLVSDTIGDFNGAPGIGPGEAFNMQLALKIVF